MALPLTTVEEALTECAAFADYLAGLAASAGESQKQLHIESQAADLRAWAAIYKEAAGS